MHNIRSEESNNKSYVSCFWWKSIEFPDFLLKCYNISQLNVLFCVILSFLSCIINVIKATLPSNRRVVLVQTVVGKYILRIFTTGLNEDD